MGSPRLALFCVSLPAPESGLFFAGKPSGALPLQPRQEAGLIVPCLAIPVVSVRLSRRRPLRHPDLLVPLGILTLAEAVVDWLPLLPGLGAFLAPSTQLQFAALSFSVSATVVLTICLSVVYGACMTILIRNLVQEECSDPVSTVPQQTGTGSCTVLGLECLGGFAVSMSPPRSCARSSGGSTSPWPSLPASNRSCHLAKIRNPDWFVETTDPVPACISVLRSLTPLTLLARHLLPCSEQARDPTREGVAPPGMPGEGQLPIPDRRYRSILKLCIGWATKPGQGVGLMGAANFDVVVVGAGSAGLTAAIGLARRLRRRRGRGGGISRRRKLVRLRLLLRKPGPSRTSSDPKASRRWPGNGAWSSTAPSPPTATACWA